MKTTLVQRLAAAFLFLGLALPALAKNLDLSTVPSRGTVQLTIYNSEDLTLVRETRRVSLKKGGNPLQFSWANTLIDPTSVELAFPGNKEKLELLDTRFPHDRPQVLLWNVQATADLEAAIEISYFTSGISWAADYLAVADAAEKTMDLEGFVKVINRSGEDYEEAQVRLVVGEINLVEKIAELAQVGRDELKDMKKEDYNQLRQKAARQVMAPPPAPAPMMAAGAMAEMSAPMVAPKEVAKEGLGEYFIYTIEGTETIPNQWSKRLRSFTAAEVPIEVVYRYREQEYGSQLVRLYLLKNDKDSKLGSTPIPNGEVRILRRDAGAEGGLRYLITRTIPYVPIGDKVDLNLGEDKEVVFELRRNRTWRDNIWQRLQKASVYKKVGEGTLKVEDDAQVAGWDEHQAFVQRIRNYTDRPIKVEVRRGFSGDVTFKSRLEAKSHDYRTVQYEKAVQPGEKAALEYEVITRNGYNAKQERVVIE